MRKFSVIFLIVCFLLNNCLVAKAQDTNPQSPIPQPNAEAALLMDARSGEILYQLNASQCLPMASTTKIMTAIVAIENAKMDDEVVVSASILDRKKVYGTLAYLEPGEKFKLQDLLYTLLLNSANDAAVAIAEHVSGNVDSFVGLMNKKSQELGAKDTNFANPHGLTQLGNYTTAKDLAIIAKYAMQNPIFAEIVKTKEKEIPRSKPDLPHTLSNLNHLLWLYSEADGIKIGYTDQAGPCLVASASKDGRRLIAVLLKAATPRVMYQDAESLLEYGFTCFTSKAVAVKGQVMQSYQLEDRQKVELALTEDIYVSQSIGNDDSVSFETRTDKITLPIKAGEQYATLDVYKQGKVIQTVPLVATTNVATLPVAQKASKQAWWGILAMVVLIILSLLRNMNRRRRRAARQLGKKYRIGGTSCTELPSNSYSKHLSS